MDFIIKNCEDSNNILDEQKLLNEITKLKSKTFEHYCGFKCEVIFYINSSSLSNNKKKKIKSELEKNENLTDKDIIIDEILKIIK